MQTRSNPARDLRALYGSARDNADLAEKPRARVEQGEPDGDGPADMQLGREFRIEREISDKPPLVPPLVGATLAP